MDNLYYHCSSNCVIFVTSSILNMFFSQRKRCILVIWLQIWQQQYRWYHSLTLPMHRDNIREQLEPECGPCNWQKRTSWPPCTLLPHFNMCHLIFSFRAFHSFNKWQPMIYLLEENSAESTKLINQNCGTLCLTWDDSSSLPISSIPEAYL